MTYANWGEGFLTDNRYYAPESVLFDTVEDAWSWRERILARAVDEDPSPLPPAGGVLEDAQRRLVWWFECGEEAS